MEKYKCLADHTSNVSWLAHVPVINTYEKANINQVSRKLLGGRRTPEQRQVRY